METVSAGVFGTLPASFFSPLASPNRALYYRTFQETPHGVERSLLIARFVDYIQAHRGQFETEEDGEADENVDEGASSNEAVEPARAMASRFLRTLLRTGWLGSEELGDYTRMVNMQGHAKPFFEALARVEEGLKTEYESHVVAVYSLICGEAVAENGHYAVLNAHASTVALGDSLKVLSQSIKDHYERLGALAANGNIPDLLHLHYDIYANDILDGAYRRLKTSDNLSRYRPRILKRVGELLADEAWLSASALKYSRTGRFTAEKAREQLETMLGEIRDILRAVDPLLDEIDRRNMLYSLDHRRAHRRPRARVRPGQGQLAAFGPSPLPGAPRERRIPLPALAPRSPRNRIPERPGGGDRSFGAGGSRTASPARAPAGAEKGGRLARRCGRRDAAFVVGGTGMRYRFVRTPSLCGLVRGRAVAPVRLFGGGGPGGTGGGRGV